MNDSQAIARFVRHHFRHFNGAALVDAASAYSAHLERGGEMLVTLAGAMSTAEIGLSLAEMIRAGKVHGICCTGANLEEDVFNLVAHEHYVRIPQYRDLTPADEDALLARHLNRVTDTCIPEHEAIRRIEAAVIEEWGAPIRKASTTFPTSSCTKSCEAANSSAIIRSTRAIAGSWLPPSAISPSSSRDGRTRR